MLNENIFEKLMGDDTFVLYEIDTIVSYYQLKHTIRWAHTRTEDEYRAHRNPYVSTFPLIKKFDDILYSKIKATNFHTTK